MKSYRFLACWLTALVFALLCGIELAQAAQKVNPSGTWTWVRELEGQEAQSVLTLSYRNGKLTGSYKRLGQVVPISKAKIDKDEIVFDAEGKWNEQKILGKFKGKLSRDEINGTIEIVIEDGSLPLAWVARRGVDADDLAGTWKLTLVTADGTRAEPRLTLSTVGGILKGTYVSSRFGKHEAKDIQLHGSQLSWTIQFGRDGRTTKAVYKGTLEAGAIKGTLVLNAGGKTTSLAFNGERTASPSAATKKKGDGKAARTPAKPGEPKSTGQAALKRRVIVMLKSQTEILVVSSSLSGSSADNKGLAHGPVFSIRSTAGKEIATEISLKELQAGYPKIYEEYRTSFANLSAGSDKQAAGRAPANGPLRAIKQNILDRGVDIGIEP